MGALSAYSLTLDFAAGDTENVTASCLATDGYPVASVVEFHLNRGCSALYVPDCQRSPPPFYGNQLDACVPYQDDRGSLYANGTYLMLPTFSNANCTGPALSVIGYLSNRCVRTLYGSQVVHPSQGVIGVTATNCTDTACSVGCQSANYNSFLCTNIGGGLWVMPYSLHIDGVSPGQSPASTVYPSVTALIFALIAWFALTG